jgi:hypothetical protein
MYKPKSENTFKERVTFGCFMMLLSWVGIPFIPFVPVIAIFGGWKMDGMGESSASFLLTCLIGLITYVSVLAWIFH